MSRAAAPLTITIPGTPDRALSPNAREHWGTKNREFQSYKLGAFVSAHAALGRNSWVPIAPKGSIVLDYTVYWEKGRKRMDRDNCIGILKACQDGIAAALMVDDRHMTVGTLEQRRDPDGVGCVVVTIRPSDEED